VELVFTVPSHQFTLGVAERRFAQLCDLHVDVEAGRKPHNYVVTLSTYENNKGLARCGQPTLRPTNVFSSVELD